jgi:hypothetical protein
MSAFNEPVVYKFFLNKYLEVVTKHNIRSSHVWNTEETGVPTVMPPCLRYKGVKQVKKTVSAERGVNTTMVAVIFYAGFISTRLHLSP